MDNDLTITNGTAPQITLDELTREEREIVEDGVLGLQEAQRGYFRVGRALCLLKARCPHGRFAAIAGTFFDIGESSRATAMKVYREYGEGEIFARAKFSKTVWQALAYAPDPQAAFEEAQSRADAGEEITKKAAREIAAAQKAQRAAESERDALKSERDAVQLRLVEATTPNQDNLIPELRRKRKSGGMTEAEANALSMLPPDLQRVEFERQRRFEVAVSEREAAERTAAQAVQQQQQSMAEAQQARAEAEEAKRRADELAREGAQSLLDDMSAQIETLNKQIARERETAWEEGKKAGARETEEIARKNYEALQRKLDESEKKNAAVQRKLTSAEGAIQSMGRERRMLEAELNGAKEQLESAHPLAKDNIHAGVINHMTEDLRALLAKLETDCEPHQRKLSEEALQSLFDLIDGYLEKQHATLIEGTTYEG